MSKFKFLKLLLCAMFLGILLAVPVSAQEQADECQDPNSEKAKSEECKTTGGDTSSAQEPAEEPSPTPTESSQPQDQSNTTAAETDVKAAQEPPTSEAPPGEQGNIQTSGTCLLEVIFRGFDTGPSNVITNVFAVPPSGDGQLIFTQSSEEELRRRESGNTVSLVKSYDLSGSVGGLQPTAGGFQVRIEVHVTGPDGRTTTRTKVDRLPCTGVAGAAVLPVEILAPGLLPETGVNVNDYLLISMMMFITGASFMRRARVTG